MDWRQGSSHLPAQPVYVLRGHTAQVHAVHFLRQNLRLLSGDADGWVVLWNVPIRRPVAVWRAHKGAVLGLGSWDDDRIITHGRDNRLCVWQLRQEDEGNLSTTLPIEDSESERKEPWLLHSLPVNALNFCPFATCRVPVPEEITDPKSPSTKKLLVAVPGVQDGHINVTSLSSEERVATMLDPKDIKTGMVMAIGLHYSDSNRLHVIAGYESGYICIFAESTATTKQWQAVYTHKSHTQPVLSLDVSPSAGYFYSSSADDILARHLLKPNSAVEPKVVRTKHAGQQSLTLRLDGRIFATAGWDGRVRVYSAKTMKELAVLKWHKEGVYAVAFATDHGQEAADSGDGVVGGEREMTVAEQRVRKTKETHWLAAGSKDGKVSLWDVY
ncbi:Astra associated protein 1 Asa1 [Friedmanniomyces endolithicus]|uniref:ASTRA-associated protein 1 n=1 Tax=Friedmanniomyces endolithicus TaxID=329885 RepID=A0AAN6KCX2_9PEZI|nr:Astra associated protein 1 Asa1 [Friedmanniomyces endolithicus]KAK0789467.1 Astra associated protein 1 Asa1 [Friedmanniomyces endolithicus]KAK0796667.1 Astra associated protein 1 Asa1 [Friedmanniomyces endolithicus]KAK0804239.1 Astra associated protein 1 Asa1 [Friedmanniomyces endolithicus]KAK0840117.1 Astra associated protein 1 Asa1 [Friedmanniomyces endolithicus]